MKFINASSDLEGLSQPIIEQCLNKLGQIAEIERERIFAKTIINQDKSGQKNIKYTILVYNNQPYDPYGTDSHRESKLNLILKPVSSQTYDYYTTYLRTKNSLYMTRAQRSFING